MPESKYKIELANSRLQDDSVARITDDDTHSLVIQFKDTLEFDLASTKQVIISCTPSSLGTTKL